MFDYVERRASSLGNLSPDVKTQLGLCNGSLTQSGKSAPFENFPFIVFCKTLTKVIEIVRIVKSVGTYTTAWLSSPSDDDNQS